MSAPRNEWNPGLASLWFDSQGRMSRGVVMLVNGDACTTENPVPVSLSEFDRKLLTDLRGLLERIADRLDHPLKPK